MPKLPLGARKWKEVWGRQVRWARTRLRLPVWPLVIWEPWIGLVVSGVAGLVALILAEVELEIIGPALIAHILLWLGAEKWFMAGRGLAYGPRAALASLVREALAPVLMVTALSGRSMKWRESDLGESWRRREPSGDGGLVMATPSLDSVITIALPDRFDSSSASVVEREVNERLRPGARVVVDGSGVSYMSAAGVRTLASVLHRATEQSARIVLCRFSGTAADCLLVSGFSALFEVAETTEEAVTRLNRAAGEAAYGCLHQLVSAG
jgi:anti-anti-sigma factor